VEVVEAPFSERAVQDELERIRTERLERGEFEQAAQSCEALIQKFPESKWVGNAFLMTARCYHELGRGDDEARTLEAFLAAFPQHVQAVTIRRALEELQRRYEEQVQDGAHPAALRDVEGRLQRLYEGLHDLKQRQEHLEDLSRAVSSLADQVDELKAKAQLLAADIEGESGEPTVLELVNALIQDLRTEVDTQRKRTDARLVAMNSSVDELKTRFKAAMRVLWAAVAAALVAFGILIGAFFQSEPPASKSRQVSKERAVRTTAVRVKIVPRKTRPASVPRDEAVAARKNASLPQAQVASPPRSDVKPAGKPEAKPAPAPAPASAKPTKTPAPAKQAAAPTQPAARAYTVKPGDTLWGICTKVLGNTRSVDKVIAMNGLKGPDYNLRPGQTLHLPTAQTPSR